MIMLCEINILQAQVPPHLSHGNDYSFISFSVPYIMPKNPRATARRPVAGAMKPAAALDAWEEADDEDVEEEAVPEAELPELPELAAAAAVEAAVARVEALEEELGANCLAALHQEVCCDSAANLFGSPGQLL
jgi:hypothetical protein